jgi:hypothetical protein
VLTDPEELAMRDGDGGVLADCAGLERRPFGLTVSR